MNVLQDEHNGRLDNIVQDISEVEDNRNINHPKESRKRNRLKQVNGTSAIFDTISGTLHTYI